VLVRCDGFVVAPLARVRELELPRRAPVPDVRDAPETAALTSSGTEGPVSNQRFDSAMAAARCGKPQARMSRPVDRCERESFPRRANGPDAPARRSPSPNSTPRLFDHGLCNPDVKLIISSKPDRRSRPELATSQALIMALTGLTLR